jgi:hypothetical protein
VFVINVNKTVMNGGIKKMIDRKVYFRDLSLPLKFAVVGSWIVSGLYAILFIVGFVGAL